MAICIHELVLKYEIKVVGKLKKFEMNLLELLNVLNYFCLNTSISFLILNS